jgi:dTDP-4-amino-4,6-dideoxygalactose transaminase
VTVGARAAVRFQRPALPPPEAIERYFRLAREQRWFSNDGPCCLLLADRLAEAVGEDVHCIPTANATLGLMVALRALSEDSPASAREVLLPSFTYIATLSAVLWAGLEPVFVDIDPEHWHASPAALEEALDQRRGSVACLLPVSTFGAAPPSKLREEWEALGQEAGVGVLVDSAAGFGATDEQGRPLGTQGDAEVFSFHATKPLAVGEGGAILTGDPEVAARIGELIRFGLASDRSLPGVPGLNAKMSEIHAAVALATLDGYDEILEARRARAMSLVAGLRPQGLVFQANAPTSTWQFVPALAPDPDAREAIFRRAEDLGVEVRSYYEPLHLMEPLRNYARVGSLPVTADFGSRIVSLPMAVDLTDAELELICACAGAESSP